MIFIGPLFPKNQEQYLISNTPSKSIQNQVNTFEWNVIGGFGGNGIFDLKIINVLPVGTFPKGYKQIILPDSRWGDNAQNYEVGCINLPILKQIIRYKKIEKILAELDDTNIIIYSTYLPFLKAVSKLDKEFKITLIVTDLPEFYDLGRTGFVKKILRKWNNKRIYECLKRVDNFVLLTEQMKEPLKIGDKPYTVVEGMVSEKGKKIIKQKTENFIVAYAGTLNYQFGIKNLINAFQILNYPDIELHLFGSGDAVEYIKKTSAEFKNIIYHGYVSKQELDKFYEKIDLLVNPRMNDGEYTKYSFPSKTMEYLASGIPVVAYKLDGIPDEYDDFLNYVPDNTAEALAKMIYDIYNDKSSMYRNRAFKGQEFVEIKKNPTAQTRRIIEMWNKNAFATIKRS